MTMSRITFSRGVAMQRPGPRHARAQALLGAAVAALLLAACSPERQTAERSRRPAEPAKPASGAHATAALDAEDGQWTRPGKSYSGLRYSQLTEITTANVKNLRPAWTFETSVLRGHEEAPLV